MIRQIYFVFILLLICPPLLMAHVFNIAYYDLSEDQQGYHLKISFDQDDIRSEIEKEYPHITALSKYEQEQELNNCLIEYVNKHVQFEFDKQSVQFKQWQFEMDESLLKIDLSLQTTASKVKNIAVKNTCLISNKSHNNIIRSHLYNKDRHFRLTYQRLATQIIYE